MFRWVRLTERGKGVVANIRHYAKEELAREFGFDPSREDVNSILTFASEEGEDLEFGQAMTLEESGWKEWVDRRIAMVILAPAPGREVPIRTVPIVDTKTGIRYTSRSAVGRALASEYGLNPKNPFAWYEIIKKDPTRFKMT